MTSYDGILFGNGMTCNLLSQLKGCIPSKKWYLLNVDDFANALINNKLSPIEKNVFFKVLYDKRTCETEICFKKMQDEIKQYYNGHDSNIEYWLGCEVFKSESNYSLIASIFPFIYNIWHECLMKYIEYAKLNNIILKFYHSAMIETGYPKYRFTTNFDLFSESILPEHLHGSFIKNFSNRIQLVLRYLDIDQSKFDFKCIWGFNGYGKLKRIQEYLKEPEYNQYFNFKFFNDETIKIERLLIYGIGFQNAGYMGDMKSGYPNKYDKATIGGIIDEHILMRIAGMQNQGILNIPVFAYYNENEKNHYQEVLEAVEIRKYELIESDNFHFSING